MTYAGRTYGVVYRVPIMKAATSHREKGQNMAERRETRQEQEVRWDAQRTARDKEFQAGQHARHKKNSRTWLIVAVIVLITAVIAAVVLL
jgi:Flp pilus assembly protein TadB